MGAFAAYTFSAGIFLLVSYLVYKWLLSSENQPTFNRMALLSLFVLAFVMPLAPAMRLPARHVVEEAAGGIDIGQLGAAVVEEVVPTWPVVLLWVYVAGMLVATLMSLVAFIRLLGILRRGRRMSVGGYTLIVLPHTALAPFSWMKYIVMSEADYAAAHDMIVLHEVSHLRLCHWVDLLIAQLVVIVLWYNPASWLMRTELRNVHEYQADSAVLRSGADARQYQLLLIKKAVGQRFPSLANSLNHSKLKNRITMMCNQPSRPGRRMRALAIVPALLVASAIVNMPVVASAIGSAASVSLGIDKVSEKTGDGQTVELKGTVNDVKNESDTPDVLPQYPGGESEMFKYLAMNMHYPEAAMTAGVQGRVVVEFVVEKDGSLSNMNVLRSVSPELDAEAVRVASSMPAWIPARSNGEAVRCKMALPVQFKLTKSDKCGKAAVDEYNAGEKDVKQGKTIDQVVVVGYGTRKKDNVEIDTNSTTVVVRNGKADCTVGDIVGDKKPVYFVDGKEVADIKDISPDKIESITVRKNDDKYPDGAIYIELKK